mgnify:CR=1 FL=1
MLKGINPIVSPNFLKPFAKWVTATSLLLQTAIFLAKVLAKSAIVIRADGHSTTDILDAVLSLIPLDTYTEKSRGAYGSCKR